MTSVYYVCYFLHVFLLLKKIIEMYRNTTYIY